MAHTVVFVCPHGAGKSRVTAALFEVAAGAGWQASSAGLEPQEQVSEHAVALLADDAAGVLLDHSAPRRLTRAASGDVIVAIDCEVAGARRWTLTESWPGPAVREELRGLTAALAGELLGRRAVR
ncbi:arsenate reductase/protein-tyrosine-phosphatase family protein [Actinomadura rudentiformis]|uniref:Phosphotyrosine protein phosphatase I domain-containing protein n=1 Tax=Actinomadura rudentiformis TaxID=359158 RepID=A0A6H9YV78_9ACTN|nr:hypothetical protein [Actinomadura rudentiformis]KAB2349686.1 hypothetical protein F8566_13095 [Actinomadura rudentiformis]